MPTDLLAQIQTALGQAFVIERELGAGGMSRVFVATEVAYGRRVVLKVLRPELIEGVSVARFKREIAFAAKLQHPHIVPLLNAGDSGGVLYYTMPFVDGESLRQRLERDIELPVSDAVRILREMSAALAYAHRHGIVHRDVKPDNVLFSDGTAVVADFGIAKALTVAKTHGDAPAGTLTQLGTSLGTPAYMAPEQVTADPNVDHRADIYALGCVAFEMLTGRPPFVGRNAQALMAAHATEQPEDVTRLRPTTPPRLATLVMQCLAKRPADRPQQAEEITRELTAVVVTPGGSSTWVAPPGHARSRLVQRTALGVGLIAAGALTTLLMSRALDRNRGEAPVRRWQIALPDSAPLAFVGSAPFGTGHPAIAISPAGDVLAYVASTGTGTRLYVRRLDEFEFHALPGTDGAFLPFFSPDGRWVAFFSGPNLKKIGVDGSGLLTLAEILEPVAGLWLPDGRLLVAEDPGTVVYAVPDAGGAPSRIKGIDIIGSTRQSLLPGDWMLSAGGRRLQLSNLKNEERLTLTAEGFAPVDSTPESERVIGSAPRFLASGHLLFTASGEDGAVIAVPFDPQRRRMLGAPRPVLRGVRQESGQDSPAQIATSDEGTLVYATGQNVARTWLIVRDRRGSTDTVPIARADYGAFRVSPDGRHVAIAVRAPSTAPVIHVVDMTQGSRVVLDARYGMGQGSWWPDGKSMLLTGVRSDRSPYTVRISARSGEVIDTIWPKGRVFAASPDTSRLLVTNGITWDLWQTPRDTTQGKPVKIAGDPAYFASYSPDGAWILYTSHSLGRFEVIVVRADNSSERYQLSPNGGEEAVWSASGDEIVYRRGRRWYSVAVSTRNVFTHGSPRLLFEGSYVNVPGWSHGLLPDKQFVLLVAPTEETTTRLNVVTNWFQEIRTLAPPTNR